MVEEMLHQVLSRLRRKSLTHSRSCYNDYNFKTLSTLETIVKFDDPDAMKKVLRFGVGISLSSVWRFMRRKYNWQKFRFLIDKIVQHVALPKQIVHSWEMATILVRVVACTPHSTDVERCTGKQLAENQYSIKFGVCYWKQICIYLPIYFNGFRALGFKRRYNNRAGIVFRTPPSRIF